MHSILRFSTGLSWRSGYYDSVGIHRRRYADCSLKSNGRRAPGTPVPSRLDREFFALPQSPQALKQLRFGRLGTDRYYHIVPASDRTHEPTASPLHHSTSRFPSSTRMGFGRDRGDAGRGLRAAHGVESAWLPLLPPRLRRRHGIATARNKAPTFAFGLEDDRPRPVFRRPAGSILPARALDGRLWPRRAWSSLAGRTWLRRKISTS